MTAAVLLSKRLVDALQPGETLFDTTVKGFAVRRQLRHPVYMLKARINGRQRWITIGRHGAPWTVETARKEAQRLWGQIHSGVNIVAVREAKRNQPTIEELCERFLEEHSRQHNKPATVLGYERNNRNHIIPLLGGRTVAEITRTDIEEFKRKIRDGITSKRTKRRREGGTGGLDVRGGPGAANRTLGQLSKMFNLAEVWGWRPENSNPVRKVIRYKEKNLERFLSTEELLRVGQVLVDFETSGAIMPSAMACIRLLIFTGARLGEMLTLQWSYVDFERRLLLLPDSKTGQKPIVLNQQAIEVLNSIPRIANCPWVIIGHLEGEHLKALQPAWDKVRRAAGIPDVRIHDLRHSFASFAVMSGGTLPVIGKLLGHNTPITTARYAHLSNDPVSHLAEITGTALAKAMASGKLPGETDVEQQKAADTFETLKGKLAELLADMDKLSKSP
ncbi:tyrosine-type recombinase/integrase [Hyphomicrobium zavarzinii]|uniref:tyrosine-type recombinase/integrase n=1 Tax=Hyphomicrobium zavarzinii TaxID=48292 RepID=UPI00037D707C|nr:site-specific integrase [Hyphomicrobium zavarzinii]